MLGKGSVGWSENGWLTSAAQNAQTLAMPKPALGPIKSSCQTHALPHLKARGKLSAGLWVSNLADVMYGARLAGLVSLERARWYAGGAMAAELALTTWPPPARGGHACNLLFGTPLAQDAGSVANPGT